MHNPEQQLLGVLVQLTPTARHWGPEPADPAVDDSAAGPSGAAAQEAQSAATIATSPRTRSAPIDAKLSKTVTWVKRSSSVMSYRLRALGGMKVTVQGWG